MADRWLVVGLGNPEVEYGGTRHNVGADIVRLVASRLGTSFKPHRVQAQVADTFDKPGGTPLSLILPFGYMNNSGGPVQQAMAFYKAPGERLVVVHDDLDLELGRLRLKMGGGTGGHNGLKDIQRHCGGPGFLRCRIGIGRPPGRQDPAAFVLKKFSANEREVIDGTVERAADAILDLVSLGLEEAQNRHHAP
ncbi:MAG: aminoacyl-tRNA hydrolase [Nitriliruptorales bacterium]|nr:aminoacyl-tRNA hydrolase [Nitriliruptorales bacterium]